MVQKDVYMAMSEKMLQIIRTRFLFLCSRSLRSVCQNMRGLIWIWRERSQKFKRLCQSWKKVSEESSFNIMMSAASMSMMMPGTCGELVHYIQGILRAKFKPG